MTARGPEFKNGDRLGTWSIIRYSDAYERRNPGQHGILESRVDIKPFEVELWMNEFELQCEFNLAETCVESITIAQLLELAGRDETALSELLPLKMTYGAIFA